MPYSRLTIHPTRWFVRPVRLTCGTGFSTSWLCFTVLTSIDPWGIV